jgi:hypothetical protein
MGLVSDEQMAKVQSSVDAAKTAEKPLNDTLGGKVGNVIGNAAMYAAAPELGAEGALARIGMSAVTGGVLGGAQPTSAGESHLTNAAAGAVGGGLGGAAGAVGGALVGGATKEGTAAAARTLAAEGVPLDAAQATGAKALTTIKNVVADNPLVGEGPLPELQIQAANRAVLRRVGVSDPNVTVATPDVLSNARDSITGVMDGVASRTKIAYDPQLQLDLSSIEQDASRRLQSSCKAAKCAPFGTI